ncbi:DUF6155 family protein [Flavobacterium sp. 9R]|uniref:DUF6155 family protein n=1 Tax=Flavobacterium sp. 9R TaxID=2653143 RepID=UPI001357EB7B|nr:DUF6155 family protein [Flavobacterium sp. 9R]
MSKRELKKYVAQLTKEQLEEQVMELYEKFSPVKVYYNFVFNPKEDTLLQEAKLKVTNEYFPVRNPGRKSKPRAKMRRSVAQKFIKHFILLGVDPFVVADLMLYTIEIAQTFAAENPIKSDTFYKSMFNSFEQATNYCVANGIFIEFKERIIGISAEAMSKKWQNRYDFETLIEKISIL